MSIKSSIKGLGDEKVRNPEIILDILDKLNITPKKEKTIKITGSKGKGTTTRLVEKMIRCTSPNANIAILTSPEEMEHTDRMKINGKDITEQEFCQIINDIKPELDRISANFTKLEYLSPSGLFLLIACIWWNKHKNIDYFVLETGRGAIYDEVGQLQTKVSIVTSILNEHPQYLGGSIETIAKHKLFVLENSDISVLGETAKNKIENNKYKIFAPHKIDRIKQYPAWYSENVSIAISGASQLMNIPAESVKEEFLKSDNKVVASFGYKKNKQQSYYYDSAISSNSIDTDFLNTIKNKSICFLVSLPDDKDIDGIIDVLKPYGDIKHIVLTGTRGYLDYDQTKQKFPNDILWTGDFNDNEGFKQQVEKLDYDIIYNMGTQTYNRLVKSALFNF